jgi:hypothetical protein
MKPTHAYIGINKQGEVRAFVTDDPGDEHDTAKLVAEWIRMGRTVERVTVEEMHRRMNPEPSEVTVRRMRDEEWRS